METRRVGLLTFVFAFFLFAQTFEEKRECTMKISTLWLNIFLDVSPPDQSFRLQQSTLSKELLSSPFLDSRLITTSSTPLQLSDNLPAALPSPNVEVRGPNPFSEESERSVASFLFLRQQASTKFMSLKTLILYLYRYSELLNKSPTFILATLSTETSSSR